MARWASAKAHSFRRRNIYHPQSRLGASARLRTRSHDRSILGVLHGQQQQLLLLLHRVVSRAMEREEEEGAGGGDAMEEEVAVKVDNLPRGADSLRLWIS